MSNMLRQLLMDPPTPELKVGPYTTKRVTDPYECELAFRHRHDVYVEAGYLEAGSVPDRIYTDMFDPLAIQIAAFDADGSVVGSTRLVPPSSMGFPVERLFRFELDNSVDPWGVAAVGRLAVSPSHRGKSRAVCVGLITMVIHHLHALGVNHWMAFMHPVLWRTLTRMGIPVERLPELAPGFNELLNRNKLPGYFAREGAAPAVCSMQAMDASLLNS